MILHLTEKMRKKLHCPALQPPSRTAAPHLSWYAHLFTAERTQYLLTTNAASLYSVVQYGRGITDDDLYLRDFLSTLCEHLEEDGFSGIYTTCIAPRTGKIELAKTADRSVLGSMNDMIQECQHHLAAGDPSPCELTKRINAIPFKALGYRLATEAFAQLPFHREPGAAVAPALPDTPRTHPGSKKS